MSAAELAALRARRIIKVDGSVILLPEKISMDKIGELIGAAIVDTVSLRHLGWPLTVMCVDDAGYEIKAVVRGNVTTLVPTRARKPVNAEATELYHANCVPGTTHQIVGDVFIGPDEDFA